MAKVPHAAAQVPGVYRRNVGNFQVTVINDGWIALDTALFAGDQAGAHALLDKHHLPKDQVATAVNQWVVNTGDKVILVDTGTSNVFGPTLGRLQNNLAAAGIKSTDVTDVVISHMHPDHIAGLLTEDKKVAFPNAVVHLNPDEYAFWTEGEIKAPDAKPFWGDFFGLARASIKPYADAGKVQLNKDGTAITPGVTTITAPGHTPGHTMVRLTPSGGDLLLWVDIVHNAALQFAEPERAIAFDANEQQAITTRKRVMDMVATDRLTIAGTHLPFPGLGHVTKSGSGFTFVPLHWNPDL